MASILEKIIDKIEARFSFDFLNRKNSPSNKTSVSGKVGGSIYQFTGNLHVHHSEQGSKTVAVDLSKSRDFVLLKLTDEWNLAPTGYRHSRLLPGDISEEQGLNVTIAPSRLREWHKESGLTISQFEPILEDLKANRFIRSFEFFEGQLTAYDELETALFIEFDPSFPSRTIIPRGVKA